MTFIEKFNKNKAIANDNTIIVQFFNKLLPILSQEPLHLARRQILEQLVLQAFKHN